MPEIAECLTRRYQIVDDLISELMTTMSTHSFTTELESFGENRMGIKLMCDFWNILKEDPNCNLKREVRKRFEVKPLDYKSIIRPQSIACYMAENPKKKETNDKNINIPCPSCGPSMPESSTAPVSPTTAVTPTDTTENIPLSKVLCNLEEAATYEKKCKDRVKDLMATQIKLQNQIHKLEAREKEGVELLKQADCMWACMEDAYKKKVAESLERQKCILKQFKEVEASHTKWRKNKKDLDFQLRNVDKCQREISELINQKGNDVKCLDKEIADYQMRMNVNKKDTDSGNKAMSNKFKSSDAKINAINAKIEKNQAALQEEIKRKNAKEHEGNGYIREAREDLQTICNVLLQKKLENEDLRAEKKTILKEIEMLKQSCDQCRGKCSEKQKSVVDELNFLNLQIANFKAKCIRCHECTDTADIRSFCTECPRCLDERDCLYSDNHCNPNPAMDCVCMNVKQKFLNNVFDNMYTILERQSKTDIGKAVADSILNCLKRSRNGKLNDETRKILQEFILTTVKKNLNLTIVGGAVKTRCEMDPETYKQLMLCLKEVKVTKPPKTEKGTAAKKDGCPRWGDVSECNCPKGAKGTCICSEKAPPPPNDPAPCPEDPDDKEGNDIVCPHKEEASDCGGNAMKNKLAAMRPPPCQEPSCPYFKDAKDTQCMICEDSISTVPQKPSDVLGFCCEEENISERSLEETDAKPMKAEDEIDSKKNFDKIRSSIDNMKPRKFTEKIKKTEIQTKLLSRENSKDAASTITNDTIKPKQSEHQLEQSKPQSNDIINNNTYETPGSHNKSITFIKSLDEEAKVTTCLVKLKVSILNENGLMENHFTNLTFTTSNILAIELDERIINLIDKRINEDPNLVVSLKRDKSDQFFIDFTSKDCECDRQKNILKRTPSGVLSFDVDEDFVNSLTTKNVCSMSKVELEKIAPAFTKKAKSGYSSPGSKSSMKIVKKPLTKVVSEQCSTLSNSSKSLVNSDSTKSLPDTVSIKATKSGELTLILNTNKSSKDQMLRISPSGAICVVIDDKVVLDMKKDDHTNRYRKVKDTNSRRGFGVEVNTSNKGVDTKCFGQYIDHASDYSERGCYSMSPNNNGIRYFIPETYHRCLQKSRSLNNRFCNSSKNTIESYTEKSSPHIVIKPNNNLVTTTTKCHHSDHCLAFTEPCTHHKCVCNGRLKRKTSSHNLSIVRYNKLKPKHFKYPSYFDYMADLPPQLPSFLKNFNYGQI